MKIVELFAQLLGPLILSVLGFGVAFLMFRYITFGWIGIMNKDQYDDKWCIRGSDGKILLHPELAGIVGIIVFLGVVVGCIEFWE